MKCRVEIYKYGSKFEIQKSIRYKIYVIKFAKNVNYKYFLKKNAKNAIRITNKTSNSKKSLVVAPRNAYQHCVMKCRVNVCEKSRERKKIA